MSRRLAACVVPGVLAAALWFGGPAWGQSDDSDVADEPAAVDVEILGQTLMTQSQDAERPVAVASVHGVRRVEGGTVLYWSVGFPPDAESSDVTSLWPNWFYTDRYGAHMGPRGMVLIDPVGRNAYDPLIHPDADRCVCSPVTYETVPHEAGQVVVFYTVMAPLPPDLESVDVVLGFGSVIGDIPVSDGLLEPAAPADERLVLLGQTWPEVDLDVVAASPDPAGSILPLLTRESTADGSLAAEESSEEVTLNLDANVLFDVDQDTLTTAASATIEAAAERINERAGAGDTVSITGHTDADGSDDYNLDLSKRRAEAVRAALEPLLTVDVTLVADGLGETMPVAGNDTDEGKARNRRVAIVFAPGEDR